MVTDRSVKARGRGRNDKIEECDSKGGEMKEEHTGVGK